MIKPPYTSRSSTKSKTQLVFTLESPRSLESKSSNAETNSNQKIASKQFIMIQPRVVEELDENNQKQVKVEFQNSISDFQIVEQTQEKKERKFSLQSVPKFPKSTSNQRVPSKQVQQL